MLIVCMPQLTSWAKMSELDLESIQDELICPMCIGTFVEPRSLHCLHSYCEACLDKLHKASNSSDALFCPECRTKTALPPAGVKGLPINFKLNRFVELLTVEQRRELVRHETQKCVSNTNPQPMCPLHEKKPLEYYCESCRVLICGQCMLDDHRVHGDVKYANEILDEHVQELQGIIPSADETIESGKDMLQNLKSEINRVDDELSARISAVGSYFEKLRNVLEERERSIVGGIQAKAKKQEKQLLKRIKALNQAMEGVNISKETLQSAVTNRSKQVGILLEENQLKARVQASIQLVKDETLDCEMYIGDLPNFPVFSPDPSVENKCKSISFNVDSPARQRSKTEFPLSDNESRGRANAFVPTEWRIKRPACRTVSHGGSDQLPVLGLSPVIPRKAASPVPPPRHFTIQNPVGEIKAKALVDHCGHTTAYPHGVCCLSQIKGALLVTDAKNHLFRIIASTGKCLETVGTEGKSDGQFFKPVAITIDQTSNILVLDGKNPGRVQVFSNRGKFLSKFKVRSLPGSSPHVIEPVGLAVLMNTRILVTDGAKHCIHEFDENGKYVGKFGNLMGLKYPAGIATRENRVVVADRDSSCILILTEHGKQLSRVGFEGAAPGNLHFPYGIALDKDGNIVVSECGNHRISIFTGGGKFVRCFGCKGSDPGMFRFPRHLCFNHLGQLVVADEENQRLQLFNLNNFNA